MDNIVEVYLIYNSCPCPSTSFQGGLPPSDMTAQVKGSGASSQTLDYQYNFMEDVFANVHCGSYSVELSPATAFLSVTKSGAFGPDGATQFYDTLTIDQSLLTDSDIGTHDITMRVFQDPAVDGYTSPSFGYITNAITYDFTVTVEACDVTLSTGTSYSTLEFPIGMNWDDDSGIVTLGSYSFVQTPACGYTLYVTVTGYPAYVKSNSPDSYDFQFAGFIYDRERAGETNSVTVTGSVQQPDDSNI